MNWTAMRPQKPRNEPLLPSACLLSARLRRALAAGTAAAEWHARRAVGGRRLPSSAHLCYSFAMLQAFGWLIMTDRRERA